MGEKGFLEIEDRNDADVGGSSNPTSPTKRTFDDRGRALLMSAHPNSSGKIHVRFLCRAMMVYKVPKRRMDIGINIVET